MHPESAVMRSEVRLLASCAVSVHRVFAEVWYAGSPNVHLYRGMLWLRSLPILLWLPYLRIIRNWRTMHDRGQKGSSSNAENTEIATPSSGRERARAGLPLAQETSASRNWGRRSFELALCFGAGEPLRLAHVYQNTQRQHLILQQPRNDGFPRADLVLSKLLLVPPLAVQRPGQHGEDLVE
jgi:hypothetical protein